MPDHASTHVLLLSEDTVIKRFRSWDRREPQREWDALRLLAQYAPGLAPAPVRASWVADPPVVVMSRLPGTPLDACAMETPHVAALAAAIDSLHHAVPSEALGQLPPSRIAPAAMVPVIRRRSSTACHDGADPVVQRALAAGRSWLASGSVDALATDEVQPVFGAGDGNLANFLWDGVDGRLVDFEDSGVSDRVIELASIAEHLTMWMHADVTASLLPSFDLAPAEVNRLRDARRLFALDWLHLLLPGGPAHDRNPPGTLRRQANRLLELLG